MKKFLFLLILLTNIVIFNACSSSVEQANSTNSNSSPVANSNSQIVQTAPANIVANAEAERRNQEVFNKSGSNNIPTVVGNLEADKNNVYKEGRPAPDDSTFNSTMNAKGQFVETRTFKSHPQLAKVERVFVTPNEKKIFVYLKNGKVIEVADEKLPTFQATVPGTILQAAGVQLNQPAPESKEDGKKVDQKTAN
jgi:hypothetical protein